MRKNGGDNDKILAEIREIKSDLESLKKQGNNANANREVSSGGRKFPRETRYRGRGCLSCKERKIGGTCQHCFACGEFGHIASECAKNLEAHANEHWQPRRRDRTCQRANWPHHKTLCNAIKREVKRTTQVSQDNDSEICMSHLTPKENEKLINLVGQRCTVTGKINEKTVEVLWDTGAQVSIVSAKFLKENFPILVTNENLELPLVGFNVIEDLIKTNKFNCGVISSNFVGMQVARASALVELINTVNHNEFCPVKTRKKDVIKPPGQSLVVPIDVKLKDNPFHTVLSDKNNESRACKSSTIQDNLPVNLPQHLKDLDLGGLTEEQRNLASKLKVEQADAFAKDDDDVKAYIEDLNRNFKSVLHGGDPQPIASSTPQFNLSDIRQAQLEDNVIGKVYSFVNRKQRPTSSQRAAESPDTKLLLHEWPKLFIAKDGVLRRQSNSHDQIVLPRQYHRTVLRKLHDNMAHLGSERVLRLARDRFYWPRMQSDVEHYVRNICRCVKQRPARLKTRAPLQPVITTAPSSWYAQAYPTRNKAAKTVAEKLYNDYILRFGFPAKIHDHQGGEFENKLLKTLEEFCGIGHCRTTPYHPQGNGQVERFNRTLLDMLRTLPENEKSRIPPVCKTLESCNGDRVLVRNLTERGGPGKLRSFWENDIYVVVNRKGPDSPVYETKRESGKRKNRVLHRKLLLPCDHLPAENPQPPTPKPPPATLRHQNGQPPRNVTAQDEETSSDEEFSDVVMVSLPRETRSAQSRNPLPTDEAVPDQNDNLAVDDNLETLELQPSTETEETLDLSGDQDNLNPVHDILTIPVVEIRDHSEYSTHLIG
ncbi:Retrovirus-related Pol poly from transposon [Paramuricea clavata]|uniref:Retrovirus-related Pol poly from transposon n=1 Tax=Paramuricea clavata TaxID=317549 RepID=A0A6S7JNP1_PARCT|nr:Retrovirus-related Pol poly from transposon [Paramuricea clavata]